MRECEREVVHVKNLATTPKKRTSLDLPPDLLDRTDEAVRLGVARSRNSLIAAALEDFLSAIDRTASIDARFAEMGSDARYHEVHLTLAARFAESDAESLAWQFGEKWDKTRPDQLAPSDLVLETDGP
jgi:hypothetical protein